MFFDYFHHLIYKLVLFCGVVGQLYVDEKLPTNGGKYFVKSGDMLSIPGIQLLKGSKAKLVDEPIPIRDVILKEGDEVRVNAVLKP